MTIDTSGKWWVGSQADDIQEYLRAYEAEGYAVDETRICECRCGSNQFEFEADVSQRRILRLRPEGAFLALNRPTGGRSH